MKPLQPLAGILLAATLLQSGCLAVAVAKVASAPVVLAGETVAQTGKVAVKGVRATGAVAGGAVGGAGRLAAAGVGSTGKVTAASMSVAGDLTSASIRSLGKLSAAGMVTFVDLTTGTVIRVPWRAGLNVYGSSAIAKLTVAERALAVIRDGRLVYHTAKALASARALSVRAGDVIRLADAV